MYISLVLCFLMLRLMPSISKDDRCVSMLTWWVSHKFGQTKGPIYQHCVEKGLNSLLPTKHFNCTHIQQMKVIIFHFYSI